LKALSASFSHKKILSAKKALYLMDLKNIPLITLNTENRSQTKLLECLQSYGLSIDSVLGDADWELTKDLLRQGFVSFYAGKQDALPSDLCFCFLHDLQLTWEFFVYGKRNQRISTLHKELVQKITEAVSTA